MNKYWTRNASLAELMLDIGKYRAHKYNVKLLQSVNKVKQKYNSLRQACRLTDISWTKSHRHTYIPSEKRKKKEYTHKLTQDQIESIQQHYESDYISFPVPDKKLHGKQFLRFSLKKSVRMYNLCKSTTRKISASTYYMYKPKAVKLQGRIPFRQSCCERCQNFKNILQDASKYMKGIPADLGDVIDKSLCAYDGFFPNIMCILCTCQYCGTAKYKQEILDANASKITDKTRRFMIKQWITKRVKKTGVTQSYID